MKLIKIVLVTLMILITAMSGVFAASQTSADCEGPVALGLLPETIYDYESEYLTNELMAFVMAKLYSSGECNAQDTQFEDVKADNEYSGYIHFVTSNGFMRPAGEKKFNPKENVLFNDVLQMLVTYVNYDKVAEGYGGYPYGYLRTANDLGWLKGITSESSGNIKLNQAVKLLENFLVSPYHLSEIDQEGNIQLEQQLGSVLSDQMGIDVYIAEIDAYKHGIVNATILKNKYDTNFNKYDEEEKVSFHTDSKIDFNHLSGAKATIYVKDDAIIYAQLDKSTTIKYEYIYAVNDDSNEESAYRPDYIGKLELYDGEDYTTAEDFTLKCNEEETTAPVKITGKFAKIIVVDNKVHTIETWDLTRGGLISGLKEGSIIYVKGTAVNTYLKDVRKYKNMQVFIDGVNASYSQLKLYSVFDYYINEDSDTVVIVASEKVIKDLFHGIGSDFIDIGEFQYKCYSDDLYYTKDGTVFEKYKSIDDMRNDDVTAYMDGKGTVLFLRQEQVMEMVDFYAVVTGGALNSGSLANPQIKMKMLADGFEEKIYDVAKKVKLDNGLTLEGVFSTANNCDGEGIYRFSINSKGEVTSIKKPNQFLGIAEAKATLATFTDSTTASIVIGNRRVYINSLSFHILREDNDKMIIEKVNYGSLRAKTADGVILRLFSNDNPNELAYIIVCGNLNNIHSQYADYYGIVTKKSRIASEDGEKVGLTLLAKGTETKYVVDKEVADLYTIGYYTKVTPGYVFNDYTIYPTGVSYDLTGKIDNWELMTGESSGLQKGIVKEIYSDRVILDDGSEYGYMIYFRAGTTFSIVQVKDGADEVSKRFVKGNISDIVPGAVIYYMRESNTVYDLFYTLQ